MKTTGRTLGRAGLVALAVILGLTAAHDAWSQESPANPPAAASDTATSTATDTATQAIAEQEENAQQPPATTSESDPSSSTPPADGAESSASATDTPALTAPADDTATAAEKVGPLDDADIPVKESDMPAGKTEPSIASQALEDAGVPLDPNARTGMETFLLAIGIVAMFVVPIIFGSWLARVWRMPDHAWKICLVLVCLVISIIVCIFGQFKFGPDLAGGITLVYELADAETQESIGETTRARQAANADPNAQIRSGGREFTVAELIAALKERLDPNGTKEITIRKYGPAVEIIIPQTGEDEMEYVKRRITDLGQLEFRITADPNLAKDRNVIDRARRLTPSQKALMNNNVKEAEWVAYDENEFGPVSDEGRIVKRQAGDTPEALVLIDPMNVTGRYLTQATETLDERGGPAVAFGFDREGAERFRQLTSQNKPNPTAPDVRRNLGIILDKRLISAPEIRETISDRGTISGGSMTDREVDHIVQILNAGSLPAALNKEPISEWTISPTLGATTVEAGKRAILWSLAAVIVFMIVYYRFAGVIACLALAFNLLLVLALMVLIKAAFTLPGLAGLVLTIGMSVDANVLIYERIREELRSGAALRMAIRNGFSRAMSAIIDSNVTTIIAGVALYYIGTDQVKGFAVTLILGILTSMFTAIFFSRLVFDICERQGWIKEVRMMKVFSAPNFDFLGVRWPAIIASLILIAIGMFAVYKRGGQMLDIDFTGGSSVTFALNESDKMPIAEVRDVLEDSELADKNLLIVELGKTNTRYSIDTNVPSVAEVQKILNEEFGDKLRTYSFEFSDVKPYTEGEYTGADAKLRINDSPEYTAADGMSRDAIRESLRRVLEKTGHTGVEPTLSNPNYRPGSGIRYKEWDLRLIGLDPAATTAVLEQLKTEMQSTPLFPAANAIGGRVSGDMQTKALMAIFVSLLGVIGYLWLRFQRVTYGLAAGVALVHDVLVTIGMMGLSHYVVQAIPPLAQALQLESFQINLTIVAALLTIIGYSLNDTIVTFDRLREIKGKSPRLTPAMVNAAVNQCLSRTILTATTVFLVVVILFFFGGEGIHSFAFAFLIGVIAGTYSTVYIAAPVLLWLEDLWERYFSGAGASAKPSRGMEPAR
jgi:SecD/SecF fusion protein